MAIKVGLFFLIGLSVIVSQGHAQSQAGRNIDDHLLIKESKKTLYGTDGNIQGSPYLNDAFTLGKVYFEKGKPSAAPLRYNIHGDCMEYQEKGQVYILDPSSRIKKVMINDVIFLVGRYNNKGKEMFGYFTLLDSGKISLLTKQVVIFHDQKEAKALESSATPAKYARSANVFYAMTSDGTITKIENLKKFISGLQDNQEEMMQFAKQEKLSVRKEDELKKLVRFYNSL